MIDGTTPLARLDLQHDGTGPLLRGWTHDGRQVAYQLSPAETAALVKRLAGYLAMLHREPADRTAETDAARDDWPSHDGRSAA